MKQKLAVLLAGILAGGLIGGPFTAGAETENRSIPRRVSKLERQVERLKIRNAALRIRVRRVERDLAVLLEGDLVFEIPENVFCDHERGEEPDPRCFRPGS